MKQVFTADRNKKILRFLPALLMMVFIFVHSAMPADLSDLESSSLAELMSKLFHLDADTASFIVRKCAHFTEYLVLGGCLLFFADGFSLPAGIKWPAIILRVALPVWGGGILYAVTDEIHQAFVPGRSCEIRDICIDAAGVLAGILIYLLIRKLCRKQNRNA